MELKPGKPLKILQIGAPVLTENSPEISRADFGATWLRELAADMIATCEEGREHTAGLAAPQVGHSIRMTVVNMAIGEEQKASARRRKEIAPEWTPLLNPRVVDVVGDEQSLIWEACLSVGAGDKQLWGPVWRYDHVVVEYETLDGETHQVSGTGFFSHLLQHEIDHLDGVLFITRVQNPESNLWLSKELDDYIDLHETYPSEK